MSSNIIQANYDTLDTVAARFGQQAEATTALQGNVLRSYQALADGGWQGRGFAAFSAEMESEIFPTLQRLTHALEEARAVTLEASAVMRQAEEEAARVFQGGDYTGMVGDGSGDGSGDGWPEGAIADVLMAGGFGPGSLSVTTLPGIVGWLVRSGFDIPLFKVDRKDGLISDLGIKWKMPFWKDSLVDEDFGTTNVKAIGGETSLGFGVTESGKFFVGAFGDVYLAKITDTKVIGDQDLGFTDETEIEVLSFEGFAGYKDEKIGFKVGVNVISAEREIGMNIAGYNAGVSGEIGLKWEWGFEFGSKGAEVSFPLASIGLSFGGAK